MTTFIVKKGEEDINKVFSTVNLQKFAVKNSAKIKYTIFNKAAEHIDDVFWKNVFRELSHNGSYKKITKIKEYNLDNIMAFNRQAAKPTKRKTSKKDEEEQKIVPELEEGVLFILSCSPQISKEYCLVYEDEIKTMKVVKDYMNRCCKVASDTDSLIVHTAMIQQEVNVVTSWKSLSNLDVKINYIDDFIKRNSTSKAETKRLELLLYNYIHQLDDSNVKFNRGVISSINSLTKINGEYFLTG